MAAPTFKVTFIDGKIEEIKLRPRAQIDYEEETGDALISLDSDQMRVSKLYKLAWFAAGKPGDFDEWIDSLDAVEMAGDEDERCEEDDNPPYLTRQLARLALYTGQPFDQVMRSELFGRVLAQEVSEYWPPERELLAVIAETLSAILISNLKWYGAKGVGKPLTIPRPHHTTLGRFGDSPPEDAGEPSDTRVSNVISFSQFKQMLDDRE